MQHGSYVLSLSPQWLNQCFQKAHQQYMKALPPPLFLSNSLFRGILSLNLVVIISGLTFLESGGSY